MLLWRASGDCKIRLARLFCPIFLPLLLEALLEPQGSVLDNLNRAEALGWVRSAADWAALRLLRNRMVHEYVDDPELLAEALNAAHQGVPDLLNAALAMADKAAGRIGPLPPSV